MFVQPKSTQKFNKRFEKLMKFCSAKFVLKVATFKALEEYNKSVHSTTDVAPKSAMQLNKDKQKDQSQIDYILYNTKCSLKDTTYPHLRYFQRDENVLLYDFLVLTKDKKGNRLDMPANQA